MTCLTRRLQPGSASSKRGAEMFVEWDPASGALTLTPVKDPRRWARPDFEAALMSLRSDWPLGGWEVSS